MNRQCPFCGGWELGDGTEDADWMPCTCDEFEDTEHEDAVNYFMTLDFNGISEEGIGE